MVRRAQRVGAAGRLGHAEGLHAQVARGNARQVFLFLLIRAVAQDGAHRIHLGVAGAAITTGLLDFFHDDRRRGDAEPRPAEFLRDQDRQVPRLGQCLDERGRIFALRVQVAPVFTGILGAEFLNLFADFLIFVGHNDRPIGQTNLFYTYVKHTPGTGKRMCGPTFSPPRYYLPRFIIPNTLRPRA